MFKKDSGMVFFYFLSGAKVRQIMVNREFYGEFLG